MSLLLKESYEVERQAILPLRRAEAVQSFSLFWLPAIFSPMPSAQREWLLIFLRRFELKLMQDLKLEKLQFMQDRTLRKRNELQDNFHKNIHRYAPVPGESRSPNQASKPQRGWEEMKAFAKNRKNPSIEPYLTERAYRFYRDNEGKFLESFLGFGGMTLLFCGGSSEQAIPSMQLPAAQKMPLPKFMRKYPMMQMLHQDFEPHEPGKIPGWFRHHPSAQRLKSELGVDFDSNNSSLRVDTFGQKSKEVFGGPIKDSLGFEGLAFVLPRLTTQDFLSQLEEDVRKWFEVFDVYVRESPEDEGFVVASKHDLRPIFRDVFETMRDDGYVYWEG